MTLDRESTAKPKPTRKSTWKAAERKSASMLGEGAERVPVTGRAMGSAPDVRHPRYAIENKLRKRLPVLLSSAMRQAVAAIRGTQIPIVILHETGKRYDDDFVVLRMRDFLVINEILRVHESSIGRPDLSPTADPSAEPVLPPA